jgi:hypothetical protein
MKMRTESTKTSAALAGAWTALGLGLAERFGQTHHLSPVVTHVVLNRVTNVVAVVVFFLGPVAAFVFGIDDKRWRPG